MKNIIVTTLSACAIALGADTLVKANEGIFDNSTPQRTYRGSSRETTSYSHKRNLERAPAPAVPDCTGEETRTVPLLTFFFDTEKAVDEESRTTASLFPCGTPPNDQTTSLDPVLVRPEDTED